MNEQIQLENREESAKIGNEEKKDEEEDTIEQVNKQLLEDKENEDEEKENINIIKDNISNNNKNSNDQLIEIEIKDKIKEEKLNNKDNDENYKNLTIQNNNFKIATDSNNIQNIQNNNNNINRTSYNQNHKNKIKNNFLNKYENYNDELKRYYFNKEYSNFHINKEENFLERMQFDIYKRQIKEERLNALVEQNKVRIDEETKIKTFNRLIEDANRRLKAQINMNDLQNQLNEDLVSSSNFYKKYNDSEWNEIYIKRFKAYQESINKKKEEIKKFYEEEKEKKEEEIINLCPNKKAPIKHILEASQKMYDEARKRKIKINKKKENKNTITEASNKNNKSIQKITTENNGKTTEGNNYKDKILNQFLMNNINNYDNIKKNNKRKIRNKSMKNDKVILNKNKTKNKIIPINNNYKKNKGYTPNKYIISYNSKNKNNKINSSNLLNNNIYLIIDQLNDNNYNLEEERNFLLQMGAKKNLQQFPDLNNDDSSEKTKLRKEKINNQIAKNKKLINKNQENSETDKMIEEFFLRNLK